MTAKTRCIECGSEDLKVLESREGVDGYGAYEFKCNECEEEFGIFFDNGNVVEYFFD